MHPDERDYHAGIAAARAGQPRDTTRPRWWLRGYDYAREAIELDVLLDAMAEISK